MYKRQAQVTCNFEEEHICSYEYDSKADFLWKRHKGSTPTSGTGPSVDVSLKVEEIPRVKFDLERKFAFKKRLTRPAPRDTTCISKQPTKMKVRLAIKNSVKYSDALNALFGSR